MRQAVGCWNTPQPCASDLTTQHSDITSYHGLIIPVFPRNGKEGKWGIGFVFALIFQSGVGFSKLDAAFMFPTSPSRGRGASPPIGALLEPKI